jgi:O-antigen/teichoic acid export membrane protein
VTARDLLRVGAGALWLFASLVAFKTAVFVVGVMISRFGGAEALGVFSVSHTTLGVALPLAGLGLSTLTLYGAAQQQSTEPLGARHALYLLSTSLAFVGVALSIRAIGGVQALSAVAVLWLLPALGQNAAAFCFAYGRGLSKPKREVVVGLVAAVVLGVGTAASRSLLHLGVACTAAALVFGGAIAHAVARQPALAPRLPRWGDLRRALTESRGYFVLDALLFGLSTLDLFAVQHTFGAQGTGMLNAATVLPRNAAFVPLFAGLLALRNSTQSGPGRLRARFLALAAVVFWVGVAPVAWALLPALSHAYTLELAPLRPVAAAALLAAPALFVMVALVPLAMSRDVTMTLGGLCVGLALAVGGAAWLTPALGAVGAVAATGAGQLVAAVTAAYVLRRAHHE